MKSAPAADGENGQVYFARLVNGNEQQQVAVKKSLLNHREVRKECENLIRLPKHPNIVKVVGFVLDDVDAPLCVTEWIENHGNLEYLLQSSEKKHEALIRNLRHNPRIFAQFCSEVLSALHEVHSQGLTHRDLAARNILLAKDGRAVVVDFGLSRQGLYGADQPWEAAVQKWIQAPEALREKNPELTTKSDCGASLC
jgi:serine/threonine protein kinase